MTLNEKGAMIDGVLRSLTRPGRTLSVGPGDQGWGLSWSGETLFANVNKHWLYVDFPVASVAHPTALPSADLLQLCSDSFMAKYGLHGTGNVLLQVEVPLAGLDRNLCHKAVEAVLVYGERHRGAIPQCADTAQVSAGTDSGAGPGHGRSAEQPETDILSSESLALYFKALEHQGWLLKDRLAANQWHIVYQGHERSFDVYLVLDRSWASLQVPLLVKGPAASNAQSPACRVALYQYLLRLNARFYWAKVGLGEHGQVLLMVDLPLQAFDMSRLRWATRTLATYADSSSHDVQIMANLDQDPRLAALLPGEGA